MEDAEGLMVLPGWSPHEEPTEMSPTSEITSEVKLGRDAGTHRCVGVMGRAQSAVTELQFFMSVCKAGGVPVCVCMCVCWGLYLRSS